MSLEDLLAIVTQSVPRYGNWGGPGWSGANQALPAPPVDSMDAYFKKHDILYSKGFYRLADTILMRDLSSLPEDPSKWKKAAKDPKYARWYRDLAKKWFAGKYKKAI